jgi:XRE family transcriptional regulator, master regulator for biofilm formation
MIGKAIKEIRKKRGLSLSELADRAKISKSYLSNIERNLNQNPSIHVMQKIAMVLDVEFNTLIMDNNQNQKQESEYDNEWLNLVAEIKELNLDKEQIEELKRIVEYLKWKSVNLK